MFWPKYPDIFRLLYPGRISRINSSNAIYLTFDDGPIPQVTPWVLALLQEYDAKASFFCIGDNVKKHPEIFQQILKQGHCIGNHTFNHLNGWKIGTSYYVNNALQCENMMLATERGSKSGNFISQLPKYRLFRPPYGRIKNSQSRALKRKGFQVVMWDVISGDYDKDFTPQDCYHNVIENASAGSLIVFHDSLKAFDNLKTVLPKVLEYYTRQGLNFRSLKDIPSANQ